jgi:hypothetical protein
VAFKAITLKNTRNAIVISDGSRRGGRLRELERTSWRRRR